MCVVFVPRCCITISFVFGGGAVLSTKSISQKYPFVCICVCDGDMRHENEHVTIPYINCILQCTNIQTSTVHIVLSRPNLHLYSLLRVHSSISKEILCVIFDVAKVEEQKRIENGIVEFVVCFRLLFLFLLLLLLTFDISTFLNVFTSTMIIMMMMTMMKSKNIHFLYFYKCKHDCKTN